jgi:pimeloyl-ACP methyl ester carboxylesterase
MRQNRYAGLSGDFRGSADSRPPLVLLHQLTCDHTIWTSCLHGLAELDPERQCLTLDLPGHGLSPGMLPHTTDHIVQLVYQAVCEAGLDSPIIVGHWTSAYIAHVYAARFPVRGVISVEPLPSPIRIAGLLQSEMSRAEEVDYSKFWEMVVKDFSFDFLPLSILETITRTCGQHAVVGSYWQELFDWPKDDLRDRLVTAAHAIESARIPYLVIFGNNISPGARARIAEIMPTAHVEIWHQGGHFPYLGFPGRFAQRLNETSSWPVSFT